MNSLQSYRSKYQNSDILKAAMWTALTYMFAFLSELIAELVSHNFFSSVKHLCALEKLLFFNMLVISATLVELLYFLSHSKFEKTIHNYYLGIPVLGLIAFSIQFGIIENETNREYFANPIGVVFALFGTLSVFVTTFIHYFCRTLIPSHI